MTSRNNLNQVKIERRREVNKLPMQIAQLKKQKNMMCKLSGIKLIAMNHQGTVPVRRRLQKFIPCFLSLFFGFVSENTKHLSKDIPTQIKILLKSFSFFMY
jgi:hypothetical protein